MGRTALPHTERLWHGLARLYVALLGTGLQDDGTVSLPEPLHAYFGASISI